MAKESFGAQKQSYDQIVEDRIKKQAEAKQKEKEYRENADNRKDFRETLHVQTNDEEMRRIIEKVDREDLHALIESKVRTELDDNKIEEELCQMERFARFRPFFKSFIQNKRAKAQVQTLQRNDIDKERNE